MGLSTDASLWWNMAGIVAAYQPVAAPGPLQARYNMARGGTNAYQATGTPPTWAAPTGWTFDGSTHYLDTGLVPVRAAWSIIARYSGTTTASPERCVLGAQQSSSCTIAVGGYWYGDQCYCGNGTEAIAAPQLLSGTLAMAGPLFYRDGVFDSSQNSGADTNTRSLYIGALNTGSASSRHQGNIQAIAIYARVLSAAEVWSVTRQMQYCEKNPDWNVWAPRRSWFLPVLSMAYAESLALGRTHGATGAGQAAASGAQAMGRTHTTTTTGAAAALSSLALGETRGATASGAVAAGAAHTLGRVATIAETGQAAASGAQTLGRIHAATNTGAAAALAAQTLRRTHATTAAGSAAASASVAAGARRGVVATAIGAALGAAAVAIRRALAAVGIEPPHGLVDLTLHARSVELTVDGRSVDLTLEDR